MTGHLFSLAKTKDEYLLVLSVINIAGMRFASHAAQESCVRAHLVAFRALPRSVDSYTEEDNLPEWGQTGLEIIDNKVRDFPDAQRIDLHAHPCPTGPTPSLPDPTGHS